MKDEKKRKEKNKKYKIKNTKRLSETIPKS